MWTNGDGDKNFENENESCLLQIMFFKNIKIIAISAGSDHSLFVADNGVVWSCGNNNYGQLGHKKSGGYPQKINHLCEKEIKIKECASGNNHNLLLSNKENVYSFGLNNHGQCGVMESSVIYIPTLIEMKDRMKSIQCYFHRSHFSSHQKMHFLFGYIHQSDFFSKHQDKTKKFETVSINEILAETSKHEIIEIQDVCLAEKFTIVKVLEMH